MDQEISENAYVDKEAIENTAQYIIEHATDICKFLNEERGLTICLVNRTFFNRFRHKAKHGSLSLEEARLCVPRQGELALGFHRIQRDDDPILLATLELNDDALYKPR